MLIRRVTKSAILDRILWRKIIHMTDLINLLRIYSEPEILKLKFCLFVIVVVYVERCMNTTN